MDERKQLSISGHECYSEMRSNSTIDQSSLPNDRICEDLSSTQTKGANISKLSKSKSFPEPAASHNYADENSRDQSLTDSASNINQSEDEKEFVLVDRESESWCPFCRSGFKKEDKTPHEAGTCIPVSNSILKQLYDAALKALRISAETFFWDVLKIFIKHYNSDPELLKILLIDLVARQAFVHCCFSEPLYG